ncbi:SixA phosphatase family protein [Novosphingobium bradum]|uniref:SixA phosphatase family protein n=1 Tax=Novosphingobium bradum TaxID=1737444 RepID=A0ABV7IWW7_9SPHN
MKKLLGLFRHAKSDWHDATARDFDRPLNQRGRKGAAVMGRHIAEHGVLWQRVIASPAVRAAQTIEMAAEAAGRTVPVEWDRRIYLASSATLADLLREIPEPTRAVLLVGHNPGLEDLIFDLVPDDGSSPLRDLVEEKFPTATYAVLELDVGKWADLDDGCARLVHLMRPRDLDPDLGPVLIDD